MDLVQGVEVEDVCDGAAEALQIGHQFLRRSQCCMHIT